MKWLIINTEAFSPKGLKKKLAAGKALAKSLKGQQKRQVMQEMCTVGFKDLPWVVQKFLSVFKSPFIILDESSFIKTNHAMEECDKSARTQVIKVLNKFGHRCIMTATVMSKSPLNVVDQYNFLKEGYFPESMYDLAEQYCIMVTIRVGRGRRVLITKDIYKNIRERLKNAYINGGEQQVRASMNSIFKQYTIDYQKQEFIIQHRKYTPFINKKELIRRIAPDTIFIKRKDLFDVTFDKFVKEPIMRPVELSDEAKRLGNELVELGFTDNMVLGRAASLELVLRLQDICNGFEPVKVDEKVTYHPFKENPKIDAFMELLEEIDVENNQVAVWSSRKNILRACAETLEKEGISYVVYDGDVKERDKKEAERKFVQHEAQVFLTNQASSAYGFNCLEDCSYGIILSVDGSVEKYYQTLHRLLRGQLTAPKFMYGIYAKGSIEERQWETLKVGQELIGAENSKGIFQFL